MKIFLVGGGEITKKDTLDIDKAAISEAGGINAKVLFFPTAANNSDTYTSTFSNYYKSLGIHNIESAKIGTEDINIIENKIEKSDLIYLGGGDTNKIIDDFKTYNLTEKIISFLERGGVLVGMSAGAMCLSTNAIVSEYNEELKIIAGLNIVDNFIIVAHYNPKNEKILQLIKHRHPDKKIIAIPDKEALFIKDYENIKLGKNLKIL